MLYTGRVLAESATCSYRIPGSSEGLSKGTILRFVSEVHTHARTHTHTRIQVYTSFAYKVISLSLSLSLCTCVIQDIPTHQSSSLLSPLSQTTHLSNVLIARPLELSTHNSHTIVMSVVIVLLLSGTHASLMFPVFSDSAPGTS